MAQTGTKRARVKKGDQVVVMAGRDKGKRGRVLEVKPAEGKVKVEGVGVVKRHQRPNPGANRPGGIIDKEAFIDISNVQLIDPKDGSPTRVRYDVGADGSRPGTRRSHRRPAGRVAAAWRRATFSTLPVGPARRRRRVQSAVLAHPHA